jgi:prepilin-type processing-associated H-X9-DG protein
MMAATYRIQGLKRFFAAILVVATGLSVTSLRAHDPPLDLSLIGNDHVGFVQIRLANLWKSDSFVPLRTLVEKAGPEMLGAFDQRFVPAPSTVERITLIFTAANNRLAEVPDTVLVVTTSRPFDRAKLIRGLLPEGVESKTGNKNCYIDADHETALCVFDQRTFAMGHSPTVSRLAPKPRGQAGVLQRGVDLAASGQSLVAMIKLESFAPTIRRMPIPPDLRVLSEVRTLLLSARLEKETHIDCKFEFADARQAKEGEQAARTAIGLALQQLQTAKAEMEAMIKGQDETRPDTAEELPKAAAGLVGLGVIKTAEEQLGKLAIERKGDALSLSLDIPSGPYGSVLAWGGFAAGLYLPGVKTVRESANHVQSQNNLKQMGLAMHNYHDTHGRFPAASICDKNGKPLLSWRVAILPFIEQNDLYQKFHLDEPWDSKHNKTLLDQMPKTYTLPAAPKQGGSNTHYRVFVGKDALFELGESKGRGIAQITDGTSNTIMIVEADESVPWTKPEGLVYDPEKPLPRLGKFYKGGANAVFADGSVHHLAATIAEATLRALITHSGGEVVPEDGW